MASTDEEPRREEDEQQHVEADETRLGLGRCQGCDGLPRWESICDGWGERWLAVCECGRIDTFFPDRRHPEQQPHDPLTLYLQGHLRPRRPATPPWIRLFLRSAQEPWSVQWRYSPEECPECSSCTTFGLLAWPRPYIAAVCTVCLACGYTISAYENPVAGTREPRLDGAVWAPACPAVQRLRECAYKIAFERPNPHI